MMPTVELLHKVFVFKFCLTVFVIFLFRYFYNSNNVLMCYIVVHGKEFQLFGWGWSCGAMALQFAGASYNLEYSKARPYCACSRCGWGLFGHFYSHLSFSSSFSLSLGDGPV